jgi:hypothetical protein
MLNLLKQPFPTFTPGRRGLLMCFLAGCCVFLVLFVFKAFGMGNLRPSVRFLHASIFALATFIVSLFHAVLLPIIVPALFREEKWTVMKEILFYVWVVICIGIANLLISYWLEGEPFSWSNLIRTIGITFSVGIFPVTVSTLIKQQSLLKRFSNEARQIGDRVFPGDHVSTHEQARPLTEKTDLSRNAFIELTGENMHDKLQLPIDSLQYMHAADNYVKIFYTTADGMQTSILRSPLKKMEETLSPYPQFYRCHRTYLVNLLKVVHISGNAQGFKLHLASTTDLIPVSRSLNTVIANKLAATKNIL